MRRTECVVGWAALIMCGEIVWPYLRVKRAAREASRASVALVADCPPDACGMDHAACLYAPGVIDGGIV